MRYARDGHEITPPFGEECRERALERRDGVIRSLRLRDDGCGAAPEISLGTALVSPECEQEIAAVAFGEHPRELAADRVPLVVVTRVRQLGHEARLRVYGIVSGDEREAAPTGHATEIGIELTAARWAARGVRHS